MSKRNLNVNLKNEFKDFKDLSIVYINFRIKLDTLKKKKYLVAVSGGPDSLALVALTKALSYKKNIKFHYVLVDHNLRKESHIEAKTVRQILKKKLIDLKIIKNKKKITKNIQSEARKIRYEILSNYCKKYNIKTILTAHNLEDQVETFFIRLSRGSGLKGLSAMKPLSNINNKVSLFRPLLDTKKNFLVKISKNIFGEYIRDPSNNDLKFLRVRVRNLKKTLEKSGIKYDQIYKSIQNLSSSKSTLETYLKKIFKELIKKKNREVSINFKRYNKLSYDIKLAIINESVKQLRHNYYDLRSKKVDNLIKNLSKKDFKRSTLGGCIFFKKNDNLCLKVEKP